MMPSRLKVFKTYSRKVSLKGVSSRYDNIECSTFLSGMVEFNDEEDLNKQTGMLAEKVFKETERDIYNAIENLMEMSKDNKNEAVLGTGTNLGKTKVHENTNTDNFDKIAGGSGLPKELEEINMEEIDKILQSNGD